MPSTYTTNNGIELIGTGEQSGTWGDTTNTNLTLVDASLDGHTSITLASAGTSGSPNDVPVTNGAASNGRNRALVFADVGDLGGDVYVRLTPNDAKKIMFVRNSLSGSRDLILFQGTYNASNDFVLAAGKDAIVKFDGGGSGAVASAVLVDLALDAATISGDLTVDTDTLYVDSANDRVGINNASPSVPLDVTGNVAVSTKIKVGDGADGGTNADEIVASKDQTNVGISILSADATGNSRILLGSQTDTTAAKIQHIESSDQLTVQAKGALQLQSGGTNDRVIVDSSGNVGIGTTSPSENLHVVSANGTNIRLEATNTSTAGGIDFYGKDAGDTTYQASSINSAGASGSLEFSADPTDAETNTRITFETDGTERVRIDDTGLGIGTTSPSVPLDVTGNAAVSDTVKIGGGASGGGSGDELSISKDQVNVGMSILAADTTGNSRIFLGSQTDTTAAKIQHDESNDQLTVQAKGALQLQTGGTNDRVTVDSSGNVAISEKVKIGTGADGGGTGDELVLSKNQTNVGMSILAADASGVARIFLGSQTDTTAASIRHSENLQRLFVQAQDDIYFQTGGTNTTMTLNDSGDLDVTGALSKGSGSFKIDHPLKPETHHLVHSFIEGPQADNLYRGTVALVGGAATVNLDTAGRMTEGTFTALNGNVQCLTTNEQGWTAVKGSVSGNILTIEAQDATCTDTVSWMVIGERHDQHMIDTAWTDAAGRVITEPEKPPVEEDETV
jgi:hypothetical protein